MPPHPTVVDALVDPDATAAACATVAPGPDSVAALAVLPIARMSDEGRIDALVAWDRLIMHAQARQAELLAAIDRAHDPAGAGPDVLADHAAENWAAAEVSCALRVSPMTAEQRIATSRELVDRLPAMHALFEAGRVSTTHVRILTERTRPLSQADAGTVESRVVVRAADQTPGAFRRCVDRALLTVTTPAVAEKQHADAFAERRVDFRSCEHGMDR